VVFEEVQSDLEAEGYEVQSFILPAAGVGAPHRRDRVWIVAYSRLFGQEKRHQQTMGSEQLCKKRITSDTTSNRRLWNRSGFAPEKGQQQGFIQAWQLAGRLERLRVQGDASNPKGEQGEWVQPEQREFSEQGQRELRGVNSAMGCGYASNPRSSGQQKQNIPTEPTKQGFNTRGYNAPGADWQNFPTQSPICNGDDGVSAGLVRYILRNGGDCYTEEEAEKEAKRIISKVRAEGIKAGGNAIVHQIALQIFKAIEDFEKQLQKPAHGVGVQH